MLACIAIDSTIVNVLSDLGGAPLVGVVVREHVQAAAAARGPPHVPVLRQRRALPQRRAAAHLARNPRKTLSSACCHRIPLLYTKHLPMQALAWLRG